MNQAKIYDLKNRLSFFLNKVRRGQSVRVYDRNCPIADIVPIRPGDGSVTDDAYLLGLESEGLIKSSKKKPSRDLFTLPPGDIESGDAAIEGLINERDSE